MLARGAHGEPRLCATAKVDESRERLTEGLRSQESTPNRWWRHRAPAPAAAEPRASDDSMILSMTFETMSRHRTRSLPALPALFLLHFFARPVGVIERQDLPFCRWGTPPTSRAWPKSPRRHRLPTAPRHPPAPRATVPPPAARGLREARRGHAARLNGCPSSRSSRAKTRARSAVSSGSSRH